MLVNTKCMKKSIVAYVSKIPSYSVDFRRISYCYKILGNRGKFKLNFRKAQYIVTSKSTVKKECNTAKET